MSANANFESDNNRSTVSRVFYLILLLTVVVGVYLDQLSKDLILRNIEPGQTLPVIEGFFNLTLTFNSGIAFGLFSGLEETTRIVFLAFSTLSALGVLLYFLLKEFREDRIGLFAISLVFAGAIGNILDRIRLGRVVDFLDFYISNKHWPAFNLADSFICVAVITLLFRQGKSARLPLAATASNPEPPSATVSGPLSSAPSDSKNS